MAELIGRSTICKDGESEATLLQVGREDDLNPRGGIIPGVGAQEKGYALAGPEAQEQREQPGHPHPEGRDTVATSSRSNTNVE